MRRALVTLSLVFVTGLGLAGGCAPQPEEPDADGLQLTLVHTNDTMGVVEPCG